MNTTQCTRTTLAVSIALILTACGGGGGTKSTPPALATTTIVQAPSPTPKPEYSEHLTISNAQSAQAAGFTGAGITIGIVDTGVMRDNPTLSGRVVDNLVYVDSGANQLSVDDAVGHGTLVAELAAGAAVGAWPGGIAPDAKIVSARIIQDGTSQEGGVTAQSGNDSGVVMRLSQIHQDLINEGVKIMNNSWDGVTWTNPSVTATLAAEYRPFIINNGGLVVFAAGNESQPNPSAITDLPSQRGINDSLPGADLERGWLVVAALAESSSNKLASYSNACGVAMNYCMVATGTTTFIGADDTASNVDYTKGSGTSFAAPLVSGAAALVWQAFPYFTNDLVRQTLLGTATDIGDPGVDAVFGYGALNIGKAVQGPAKFDWGDVTVNFDGMSSTWSNSISGSGGLIKQGTGTLALTASSSYTGQTNVQGGTLRLQNGATLASATTIAQGGTLAGNGGVAGLSNHGTLRIDDATFIVNGNYAQGSDGRLAVMLGNTFQVSGTASLAGELNVVGVRQGYVTQAREYVLTANGGLSGQFDSLIAASGVFLQATPGYSATQAWLDISQIDVATAALSISGITPAAMSAAERVQQTFDRINTQRNGGGGAIADDLIGAAAAIQQTSTPHAAAVTLESLSGQAHAAAMAMTFDSIDMSRRALSARFGQVNASESAIWMQQLGGDGQAGYVGSNYDVNGWMLGREASVGGARVGFAFGQTHANVAGGVAQDRNRDVQTQAQFYIGQQWGHAYALGQVGMGHYQRDLDRGLLIGGERADVAARYNGRFLSGNVEAGYRLGAGAASLTPYLSAGYARIDNDAFAEQGGYGLGLSAGDWRVSRMQALAGLRGHWQWRGLSFNGYAEWQQALSETGAMLDARFVGVDAAAPLYGLQTRSSGLMGLSADAWLSRNAHLSLGYDQRFGGARENDRQAMLRFTREF